MQRLLVMLGAIAVLALVPAAGAQEGHPDFAIGCAPDVLEVAAGSAGAAMCSVDSLGDFEGQITLACQAPTGVACGFEPNPVALRPNSSASSALSASVDGDVLPGEYSLLIVATGEPGVRFFPMTLTVAAPCECESVRIKPIVQIQLDKKKETVTIPKPEGAVNGDDATVYDVTITVEWDKFVKCVGDPGVCTGTYLPLVRSRDWKINGKEAKPRPGTESVKGAGAGGAIVCQGKCDGAEHKTEVTTVYKAQIKAVGEKGEVRGKISGTVEINVAPPLFDCPGNRWTIILVYRSEFGVKAEIDPENSDWDGDGLPNHKETGPPKDTDAFNPDTDGDGFNDGVDKHPLNPDKH